MGVAGGMPCVPQGGDNGIQPSCYGTAAEGEQAVLADKPRALPGAIADKIDTALDLGDRAAR